MNVPRRGALRSSFGSFDSVRGRLTMLMLVTTAVALLTMTLALLQRDLTEYRRALLADVSTQAAIMARLTLPAMEFDDEPAAQRALSALSAKPAILNAALYLPDGRLYSGYSRNAADPPPPRLELPPEHLQLADGRAHATSPVQRDGERFGVIHLSASYAIWDHIRTYAIILGAMMAFSMIVALILSARLRRAITGPVEALAEVADNIVTRRDPSLRAADTPLEEFSVVVKAFNNVLDESAARTRELQESHRALREADRRKDDFLATLAHELRNPLAPIRHAAKLLGIRGLDAAQAHTAREIISRQVARMALLLDDLLEVSRITRGRLELRREMVSLNSVVKAAVETSRPLLDSKRHEFSIRLPAVPIEMHVDPLRMSQALSNLLTNAAKYTDPGGRIELAVRHTGEELLMSVSDSGIGVPAAALPAIFEMFSQVDSAIDRAEGGLGIGLALVKGLVGLHGGTVQAASDGPGRGSTFTIRIPGDAVRAAPSGEQREMTEQTPNGPAGRVLVVDDNRDAASSLAMVLSSGGHTALTAFSGPEALQIGEKERPQAVVLDIGMPRMNGYEVARRIRQSDWGRQVLLVALTGWGQKEDIERAIQAGFDCHMTKPADPDRIEQMLDAFLRSRSAATATSQEN